MGAFWRQEDGDGCDGKLSAASSQQLDRIARAAEDGCGDPSGVFTRPWAYLVGQGEAAGEHAPARMPETGAVRGRERERDQQF